MTEKDYLRKLGCYSDIVSLGYQNLCLTALEKAKEAGAKFDPELVELPDLSIHSVGDGLAYVCLKTPADSSSGSRYPGKTIVPTEDQSKEIIRRCKLFERLEKYIRSSYLRDPSCHMTELLDILDCR